MYVGSVKHKLRSLCILTQKDEAQGLTPQNMEDTETVWICLTGLKLQ